MATAGTFGVRGIVVRVTRRLLALLNVPQEAHDPIVSTMVTTCQIHDMRIRARARGVFQPLLDRASGYEHVEHQLLRAGLDCRDPLATRGACPPAAPAGLDALVGAHGVPRCVAEDFESFLAYYALPADLRRRGIVVLMLAFEVHIQRVRSALVALVDDLRARAIQRERVQATLPPLGDAFWRLAPPAPDP